MRNSRTPLLTLSQILSDAVSKDLSSDLVCCSTRPKRPLGDAQLQGEGRDEDSAQHGVIPPDEGAAGGGQLTLGRRGCAWGVLLVDEG